MFIRVSWTEPNGRRRYRRFTSGEEACRFAEKTRYELMAGISHLPGNLSRHQLTPERWERRIRVVQLHHAGYTFAAIGAVLGISAPRAHQLYWSAMRLVPFDLRPVAMYRRHVARVEQAMERLANRTNTPDTVITGGLNTEQEED